MSNSSSADVTISVVVDQELQTWLKARAKIEDRSVSSVVRSAITEYRERVEVKAAQEAKNG